MKVLKKYYKQLLSLIVVALFIWYFFANRESFKPILDIKWIYLVLVAILDVVLVTFNGLFLKFVVEPFGKFLKYTESIYVSVLSSIGNFFAPAGGGLGFRAVYLKTKHNLPYASYLSTLSGNYVVVFICTSLFGLIALLLSGAPVNAKFTLLAVVFLAIFTGSLITMFLPTISEARVNKFKSKRIKKLVGIIAQVANGWDMIKTNKLLILKLAIVTLLSFATSCLINYSIGASLNIHLTLAGTFLMTALGSLSFIINITPANFGVKETIYAFSATIIGISAPQALSIALIDRGVVFFVFLLMWLVTGGLKKRYEKDLAEKK